ncbi:helix-turn-helix domain-containing protein [Bernardetia sp.]|uniref:helix-turn-helix domain-containing protein n=1 Tax=Bernardetia sp. TaxID=1937974 RepID=UPI0025B849CA|nr:AraC family transcriptional regulator [Bernardetia sp.]
MTTYLLPNDLLENKDQQICIYDYLISNTVTKNKITLNQNIFSFLQEGIKEVTHFDKHITIQNDKFLLIKSGKCLMTEKLSQKKQYRSFLLFFDDDWLISFIEKYKVILENNNTPSPFIAFDYDRYIRNFVLSLIHIHEESKMLQQQILHTKLEEIMLYLVHKNGAAFLYKFLNSTIYNKEHFTSVIENNIYTNLSVEELAFLCNKSISAFKREFKKVYDDSPIKWFREKRLSHAAFLLKHKKLRASDIYMQVGYESLSSFIQAYKKHFGKTPKQHTI